MSHEHVSADRFIDKINSYSKVGIITVPVLLTALVVIMLLIGKLPLIVYLAICLEVTIVVMLVILFGIYLTPSKIHFTDRELIVKSALGKTSRYKVSTILAVDNVPNITPLMCTGNRGFLGWWAYCDTSEGPITLIAQYRCKYLYKVITEDGKILYVCTSEPLY